MPNLVIYDLETSDSSLHFSQILECAMILVNDNLQELDRAVFHARLNKTFIPHPGALITNKISIKRLKETNLSEYQMTKQLVDTLSKWGKNISMGWNSTNFDRNIIRSTMFRNLEKTYILNSNGNSEADLIHVARSAHLFYPGSIKTGTTSKGNAEFKLTSISAANDLKHEDKHTALSDCEATLSTAKLLKEKAKSVWDSSMLTTSKQEVMKILENEQMVIVTENYGGGPRPHLVTYLCPHPKFTWPLCVDLRHDIDHLLTLNVHHLKEELKGKPKPVRTIKHSAHPILMNPSYLNNFEPYNAIGMTKLLERAKKIKMNKEFAEKVSLIKKEEVEEKEANNQVDKFVEETIYSGGFPGSKDQKVIEDFNQTDNWKDKYNLRNKFTDERYSYFAKRLIYENSPELLDPTEYKQISKFFADNFLSTEKKPFTTIPSAMQAIDDLRNKHEGNDEIISQLEEINGYIEELQTMYEKAK